MVALGTSTTLVAYNHPMDSLTCQRQETQDPCYRAEVKCQKRRAGPSGGSKRTLLPNLLQLLEAPTDLGTQLSSSIQSNSLLSPFLMSPFAESLGSSAQV